MYLLFNAVIWHTSYLLFARIEDCMVFGEYIKVQAQFRGVLSCKAKYLPRVNFSTFNCLVSGHCTDQCWTRMKQSADVHHVQGLWLHQYLRCKFVINNPPMCWQRNSLWTKSAHFELGRTMYIKDVVPLNLHLIWSMFSSYNIPLCQTMHWCDTSTIDNQVC